MTHKKAKNPLDRFSEKRGRGRPRRMRFSEIGGRANNFRWIFDQVWDRFWPLFAKAETKEQVVQAFEKGASPYHGNFLPWAAPLALRVKRERRFPKTRTAQSNFLADSLAGVGVVSPRRSRDICERDRADAKRATYIIRREFYVECSCGYKGPARDNACPKCKAGIPGGLFGTDLFHQT